MAVSALKPQFEGQYSRCEPEPVMDVSETVSSRNHRRADALLEFETDHHLYGRGIIIEVQYRNRGKNIQATTLDYLSHGFSVYWTSPEDFTDSRFLFDKITDGIEQSNDAFLASDVSPADIQPLDPPVRFSE